MNYYLDYYSNMWSIFFVKNKKVFSNKEEFSIGGESSFVRILEKKTDKETDKKIINKKTNKKTNKKIFKNGVSSEWKKDVIEIVSSFTHTNFFNIKYPFH